MPSFKETLLGCNFPNFTCCVQLREQGDREGVYYKEKTLRLGRFTTANKHKRVLQNGLILHEMVRGSTEAYFASKSRPSLPSEPPILHRWHLHVT